MAVAVDVDCGRLKGARQHLQPVFDAVTRAVTMHDPMPKPEAPRTPTASTVAASLHRPSRPRSSPMLGADVSTPKKRGPKPRPIVEFPEPLWTEWQEPEIDAPAKLDDEMNKLLRFKTATLTAFGFQRNEVWNDETEKSVKRTSAKCLLQPKHVLRGVAPDHPAIRHLQPLHRSRCDQGPSAPRAA